MTSDEMKARTKRFGLDVIILVTELPRDPVGNVIGRQLVRCATSVGANYRAACRGKSAADFVAKLKIVEEEADESLYWLELLRESRIVPSEILQPLLSEADQLVAITVATIKKKRETM